MHDIKPLEEKWKRYKKKRRRPWYIFSFTILIIMGIIFTFVNYEKINIVQLTDSNEKKNIPFKSSLFLLNDALVALEKRDLESLVSIREEAVETTSSPLPILKEIPILEDVLTEQTEVEKPKKKISLTIVESSSMRAYKDVERRFIQSHDIDDSLFLARAYYRKGKYKKSEYWALQTNKVNKNIDESWIIFAKSKVKLGHINEAIRILTSYLNRIHSPNAKSLLVKLKESN